jgi:dienelactone hydrolase
MKTTAIIFLIFVSAQLSFAQTAPAAAQSQPELIKVDADPAAGFAYPYYMYVPAALRDAGEKGKIQTLLILPNNTGKISDDMKVHEEAVKRRSAQYVETASKLGVIVLAPVFPRPESDWQIYTHALDRDAMLTDKKEYRRFDLQLLAMIDHARRNLAKEKLKTGKRLLIMGFSASGMFSNRFTFLHPERVKAAAVGSPGGWPIAPVETYKEKTLRYPIGTGDFKATTGHKLNIKALRKVPFFIYLGDKDDNDSLPFTDGYEPEDKELVFALFGETPVSRWEIIKKIYLDAKLDATFKLYPNAKHMVTPAMYNDLVEFFKANK